MKHTNSAHHNHSVGGTLYLSQENPFESIKHINTYKDITKELWLQLDKERNLDAKWYLLRYYVFDNEQYIKDVLGTKKKFDQLTIDDFYKIAEKFKNDLGINKPNNKESQEEQYPITTYIEQGYLKWFQEKYKDSPEVHPISIEKRFVGENNLGDLPKINELLSMEIKVSQKIGDYKISKLIEDYLHEGESSLFELIEYQQGEENLYHHLSQNDRLYKFVKTKTNLPYLTKEHYLIILENFTHEVFNLFCTIHRLLEIVTKRGEVYEAIKLQFDNDLKRELGDIVQFINTPTKNVQRIFEKLIGSYDGKISEIKDIVRCSYIFPDINSLIGGVQCILKSLHKEEMYPKIKQNSHGVPIIEVDDKVGLLLQKPLKKSGYRDFKLVLHFRGKENLIPMEIQFQLEDMYKVKNQGVYGVYSLLKRRGLQDVQIHTLNNYLGAIQLPTSDDEVISSDNIYHMRRRIIDDRQTKKNQKEHQDNTPSKNVFMIGVKVIADTIDSIFNPSQENEVNKEKIVQLLSSIESTINDNAWLKILTKVNLPEKGFYTLPGVIESSNSRFGSQIENNLSK